MSLTIASIESAALKLLRSERAAVAPHLLDSLREEPAEFSPQAIEKAWIDESVRRLEAYHRRDMKAYFEGEVIRGL